MNYQQRVAYIVTERNGKKPEWTRAGRGKLYEDGTEDLHLTVTITDPRTQRIVIRDWKEPLE